MRAPPLSRHLSAYRFAYTMALSFGHRISGLFLALGLPVLVWWLMAAAGDESAYAQVANVLSGWFGRLLLLGWLGAFLLHFCNGIRHLFWDAGLGFERHQARRSALIVVVTVALAFIVCAWLLFFGGGAP